MNRNLTVLFASLALLMGVLACGASTSDVPDEAAAPQAEADVVSEADVQLPTDSSPTEPPEPTPEPEPIILSGSGDSILDVDKPAAPMLVSIKGNSCSRYFGVTAFNEDNEEINLLVSTTDPYEGSRPLDFFDFQLTKRIQVESSCEWEISVLSLSATRTLTVPGSISGTGDEIFLLDGGTPDLVHVVGNSVGNSEGRYFSVFGVFGYSDFPDLVVNLVVHTTDPYDGTGILNVDTVAIEVQAVGEWTIEISEK